jgi:hypothetical protein
MTSTTPPDTLSVGDDHDPFQDRPDGCNCDNTVSEPHRYNGCPVHGHLFAAQQGAAPSSAGVKVSKETMDWAESQVPAIEEARARGDKTRPFSVFKAEVEAHLGRTPLDVEGLVERALCEADELHLAPSGAGPRAYDWSDKPHRIVYDACALIRELATALKTLAAWKRGGQTAAKHRDLFIAENERLREALKNCVLQLEYVQEKYPTGTGEAEILRARAALEAEK